MGNGKRTPLRFASTGVKVREGTPGVGGFGWFPGCLVGLKGRNGGGGSFEVDEVIMVCLPALSSGTSNDQFDFSRHRSRWNVRHARVLLPCSKTACRAQPYR